MINCIRLHTYKFPPGKTSQETEAFIKEIPLIIRQKLICLSVKTIDIYCTDTNKKYTAGSTNRVVIFVNASTFDANKIKIEPVKINGIENNFTDIYEPSNKGDLLITSPEGMPLAEWFDDSNELYILFNVLEKYNQSNLNIFSYIMEEFNNLVWRKKLLDKSWIYTSFKNDLIKSITNTYKEQKERLIVGEQRTIERIEQDLIQIRKNLKYTYDNLITRRKFVETEKQNIKSTVDFLIKDLDLIAKHEKVDDLQIVNDCFHIYTKPLYIYDDKGKKYIGGKYCLKINLNNSDIRIKSNNPRQGYWSPQDPHPHVSGNNFEPCLGSVSDTIAELCSQMQLYALILVCFDFLESTNTEDVAGAFIKNWDEIDEDGNIIPPKKKDMIECFNCSELCDEDDLYEVYNYIDNDGNIEEECFVCENCLNKDYTFSHEHEEYIDTAALLEYERHMEEVEANV